VKCSFTKCDKLLNQLTGLIFVTMRSYAAFWLFSWLFFSSLGAWAQQEARSWYFDSKIGFDFSASMPRPLANSARRVGPASVSLADKRTGQLLFYSDARQIWNREHRLLPHGDSLASPYADAFTIPQGALALPVPGQDQQYYLFTLAPTLRIDGVSAPAILRYSVLDMRLDNGLGDVVAGQKNHLVAAAVNYQLCAVPHRNGRDYWLLTRQWDSNAFGVYLVSAQGVALTRTQAIGPVPGKLRDIKGFLKASPDGRKVAYATSETLPLSLFDFDAATGEFSHYLNLGKLLTAGGLSFSPDNSKLYVQNYTSLPNQSPGGNLRNVINQFDLAAGSDAAIIASGMSIVANNPTTNIRADEQGSNGLYTFQLGPDGRLYGNSSYSAPGVPEVTGEENMYVINAPNRRGFACEVQYQRFVFAPGDKLATGGFGGLPAFLESYFNGLEPVAQPCTGVALSLFPNPTASTFQLQAPEACFTPYHIVLYNALGQQVYEQAVTSALSQVVDIQLLAPGIYVLEAQVGGTYWRSKVLKGPG
jgi:hypothetical protein